MANILFFHTGIPLPNGNYGRLCYYDGFIEALKNAGNNVLEILNNTLIYNLWNSDTQTKWEVDVKKFEESIRKFNPDLVVCFNNVVYPGIDKLVDCPIAVFSADTPAYFNDKNFIIKGGAADRYFMAASQQDVDELKKDFGISENKIILFRPATSIKPLAITQDKNISFIGTRFSPTMRVRNFLWNNFNNVRAQTSLHKADLIHYVQKIEALKGREYLEKIDETDRQSVVSMDNRFEVLFHLKNMGLCIYGDNAWTDYINVSISFFSMLPARFFYSLAHNEHIYNSSKICLSISHAQARAEAFPWRIADIMASNGCLVADYKPIYKELYGVDLPTYKTAREAEALCKELLKDDTARREIVVASQQAIHKAHTWEHRLVLLEDTFKIKLFSDTPGVVDTKKIEEKLAYRQALVLTQGVFNTLLWAHHKLAWGKKYSITTSPMLYSLKAERSGVFKRMSEQMSHVKKLARFLLGIFRKAKMNLYQ